MTMKALLQGGVMAMLLLTTSSSWAQSSADLVALFDAPCARYGVPKPLALAIAGHESGGRPWALNIAGQPILHASRDEALAVARAALHSGRSFDVGIMQVNSQWLRRYHLPLEVVFDPRGNIQVGVWILAQSIKRYGLTWQAIATYHTPNPERGRIYAAAVLARLRRYGLGMSAGNFFSRREVSPAASAMVVFRREVASK